MSIGNESVVKLFSEASIIDNAWHSRRWDVAMVANNGYIAHLMQYAIREETPEMYKDDDLYQMMRDHAKEEFDLHPAVIEEGLFECAYRAMQKELGHGSA